MFLVKWLWSGLTYLGLANKHAKLTLLGLDNAGKSTLLHVLGTDRVLVHEPTRHAQSDEVKVGNITFRAHDLGGHQAARRLWKTYLVATDAIVFVIDATDSKRFEESKRELQGLLADDTLSCSVPVLVLGNKIDSSSAVSEAKLREALGLVDKEEQGHRPVRLFMCSVVKRAGYAEGFRWLSTFVR